VKISRQLSRSAEKAGGVGDVVEGVVVDGALGGGLGLPHLVDAQACWGAGPAAAQELSAGFVNLWIFAGTLELQYLRFQYRERLIDIGFRGEIADFHQLQVVRL